MLDVVCGGYQTIVLFEEKQMEEDQDIESRHLSYEIFFIKNLFII